MSSLAEYGITRPLNATVEVIPEAVVVFNELVESVRGSENTEPQSATEKAVRAALLNGVSDAAKEACAQITEILNGIEDSDALYVLTEVRRTLIGVENDAEFAVYEGVKNSKDDGSAADDSLAGTFKFLKDSIEAAWKVAQIMGEDAALIKRAKDVEKENNRREKYNAKIGDAESPLPLIHPPVRLKSGEWIPNRLNVPQGLEDGKKGGRKAETFKFGWIVEDDDTPIEVPAGTPVPELLSRYLRNVTLAEFVKAWQTAARKAKEAKQEGQNRRLVFADGTTVLAVHPDNITEKEG